MKTLDLKPTDIVIPEMKYREVQDDQEKYEEVKKSISIHGIKSPIVINHANGVYNLVDGLQRLSIAKELGLETVPCSISNDMSLDEIDAVQYIMNEHRIKTKASDQVTHFLKFMARNPNMTQTDVSDFFGLKASTLSNLLNLRKLTPELMDLVNKGKIALAKGFYLARIPEEHQNELMQQAIDLPTNEFAEIQAAYKKQLKKGAKPDLDNMVVLHPLSRKELEILYTVTKTNLDSLDPQDPKYEHAAGAWDTIQQVMQTDPDSVAAKKKVREDKIRERNEKQLADMQEKLNAKKEKMEPLNV